MIIYNYDKFTTEFISEREATLDPMATKRKGENVYTIPLYATDIVPLEPKEGFAICFNGATWEYREDHRGLTVYDKQTLEPIKIKDIGKIPNNVLLEIPKSDDEYQYWENGKYVYPKLSELRNKIKMDLDRMYEDKLNTLYKLGNYYVQPSWANIYTNTLVAMQQDMNDNGKLDQEYKILVIVDKKGIMNQIRIKNIDEFLPYYNKVKELYKKLTEDYHNKIVAISVTNDSKELVNIINSY